MSSYVLLAVSRKIRKWAAMTAITTELGVKARVNIWNNVNSRTVSNKTRIAIPPSAVHVTLLRCCFLSLNTMYLRLPLLFSPQAPITRWKLSRETSKERTLMPRSTLPYMEKKETLASGSWKVAISRGESKSMNVMRGFETLQLEKLRKLCYWLHRCCFVELIRVPRWIFNVIGSLLVTVDQETHFQEIKLEGEGGSVHGQE